MIILKIKKVKLFMRKKIYSFIPIIAVALIIIFSLYKNKEDYIKKTIIISDTILNITADTTEKKFNQIINSITNEINRMDNIINPYNQKSEIAIINKKSLQGIKEIEISKEIAHIFETGLKYSKIASSFDITVRPLIELWGFGIKENQTVPKQFEIDKALKSGIITKNKAARQKSRIAKKLNNNN